MRVFPLVALIACSCLFACAQKFRPEQTPERVRVVEIVPPGLKCELLGQDRANEGYGCGFASNQGRTGYSELAHNIMRSKALRAKANTVVIRNITNSYDIVGCERQHIQIDFDLMFCQQPVDLAPQSK